MTRRSGHQGNNSFPAGRVLLLLALLPALLLGPACGGAAVWFHSHGTFGDHVHVVHDSHGSDIAHLDGWHAGEHRAAPSGHGPDAPYGEDRNDEDPREVVKDHAPVPPGFRIDLPELRATAFPGAAASALAQPLAPDLIIPPRWHVAVTDRIPPGRIRHAGWPPQPRTGRTGVPALLLSSHALLN